MYAWEPEQAIDAELMCQRIDRALELRAQLSQQSPHDGMRMVYSEADQLSGLVVDRFGQHLVMQVTAAALMPFVDVLAGRLRERLQPASITLQIDPKTIASEGVEGFGVAGDGVAGDGVAGDRVLYGESPSAPIVLRENGLEWGIDLASGQKTGYYLDQRENRMAAARWAPAGGRVLDVCTYAGGFALTIARWAPGVQVVGVDSSSKALELSAANAARNGLEDRVRWEQADLFEALSQRVDRKETLDMIVLDPPKLAGSRDQLQRALAAYHRLNYMALRCLRPGGILVTCSCSGRVSREDFREMLLGVSGRARRELQILENRGASADHPVAIHCPETDYLKCILARVL
jgi:23S rRNA (cytosine1962-C5)-methyltransferase